MSRPAGGLTGPCGGTRAPDPGMNQRPGNQTFPSNPVIQIQEIQEIMTFLDQEFVEFLQFLEFH